MPCSPARLAANRANSSRSTGPRTEAGKDRSRANSLKHGMTGDGVVMASRDAAEVADLSRELEADLRPTNAASRVLLKRFAVLAVRLDRCVEHGDAIRAGQARDADHAFLIARTAEIKVIGTHLEHRPAATVRTLKETAQGIDWLVGTWLAIKKDLGRGRKVRWQRWHLDRIDNLQGRYPGESPPSRFDAACRAGWGDFSGLPADPGTPTPRERKVLARRQVAAMIDEEVAALRAMAPTRDPDEEAADRAQAPARALFDPSPEANLARKYEAAAERGLFRALRDFRQLEGWAEGRDSGPTPPPRAADPRPEPTPEIEPKEEEVEGPEPAVPPAKTNPTDPPRTLDPPAPLDWEPAFWQPPSPLPPGLPSIREMTGYGSGGGGPA
ncbi:hypothetical protein TA3x_002787 [Tundrisphaera sp. TA3]|uniref:hypothetical protein n=1 Tax=Tundrisphaera sp. TA3 TaxID=3435775 RepID=UPI003EB81D19